MARTESSEETFLAALSNWSRTCFGVDSPFPEDDDRSLRPP